MAERERAEQPARVERSAGSLRILHVLAPGEAGGLERVVQSLALAQARRGHQVHVAPILDLGRHDHPFLAPLEGGPVHLHPRESAPRGYPGDVRFVRTLCRALEPDVAHTHGYRADVLAGWAARRASVATVTTVHGFTGGGWKNRLYERLQRRSYRNFQAVVPVSVPLAEGLRRGGIDDEKLELVPNAWAGGDTLVERPEARSRLRLPAEVPVAGWVGRLSREKGPDVLVDALNLLRDCELLVSVIGDGPERKPLEERAGRAGTAHRLRWHGRVADAGRLFPAFDVLVLSSRTEGTPMVLFEAMEARVPVVATAVGGVPDVVSGEEALLVPPESPEALAAAIRSVLAEPEEARARARRARARLHRDFGPEPWVARYDEVYGRAMARRDARAT